MAQPVSTPRPLTAVPLGLLFGACLGVLETCLRLRGQAELSLARRVPELLSYAALWYGLAGALLAGLAAGVARIGERRGWHSAREGSQAVMAGTLISLTLPGALLLALGPRLLRQPAATRAMLLALILLLSAVAGWFVARRLAARPGGPLCGLLRRLWAPRLGLALALLAAGGSSALLWSEQRELRQRSLPARSDATPQAHADAPNVLLILVDTLRADALGCYGAESPTPTIDRLARAGTLFERTQAPASWTLPSVASLFTSTPPWRHGCTNFNLEIAELTSLASVFETAGYETLAAVGNPFVNEAAGYARGFQVYDLDSQAIEEQLFASRLFDALLRQAGLAQGPRVVLPWWDDALPFFDTRLGSYLLDEDLVDNVERHAWPGGERPYFLYVQAVAPHTPYLEHPLGLLKNQPELVEENLAALRRRYAEEVRYTDDQIARLLDGLDEDGLLERTLVVITSDHGEEFAEHGDFEHGYTLYGEVVDVPLILSGPGVAADKRVAERVELMDLAPTLLELCGLPVPESFMGRSLGALVADGAGHADPAERRVFGETGPSFLTPEHRVFSVTQGTRRLVRKVTLKGVAVTEEAFDLATDPGEQSPLDPSLADFRELRDALDLFQAIDRTEGTPASAQHDLDQMRALGYVDDGESSGDGE